MSGDKVSPTDVKFASRSDDGTVRFGISIRTEEKILRGHGADVKQCDWHPSKGIVASGRQRFYEFKKKNYFLKFF